MKCPENDEKKKRKDNKDKTKYMLIQFFFII